MFVNAFERKRENALLRKQQEQLSKRLTTLEQTAVESALIAELGDLLQACRTADEAYPILANFAQQLAPQASGAIYLIHQNDDRAEKVASWGEHLKEQAESNIVLNDCWGLRRGRLHLVKDLENDPICGHILADISPQTYLCAPLIAHGEMVGLFHLCCNGTETGTAAELIETYQHPAQKISEQAAIGLSNLTLRDRLRSQAIRDPLTGLFNRRYMEETLERELRRANRQNASVGVIMFDVDKLKPINDRYGHDAGDVLLRSLGSLLVRFFRGEDVACRYGGDEFTIILPETRLADLWQRADQLRDAFKKMYLEHNGNRFGPATLSIGLSVYPDHGVTAEKLIQIADAAAYQAKAEGGDRVMIARPEEQV
jgi:diguanylate cyclase (GGDEF)-like protein